MEAETLCLERALALPRRIPFARRSQARSFKRVLLGVSLRENSPPDCFHLLTLPPQLKWAHPFGCAHAFLAVSAPRHFVFGTFVPIFPTCPALSMVKHVDKAEFRGLSPFCLNGSQFSRFFFSSPASVNGTDCGHPLSIIYVRPPLSNPSVTQHVVKNHRAESKICDAVNNEKAILRRAYQDGCIVTLSSEIVKAANLFQKENQLITCFSFLFCNFGLKPRKTKD